MMVEGDISRRLASRYEQAGGRLGRLRLRIYVAWKFMAWRTTMASVAAVKRGGDFVISFLLLCFLSPVFLVVAAFVGSDRGPVFFRQARVGLRGRKFQMLKFRSMCVGAEKKLEELAHLNEKRDGVTFKISNDPRITAVGRIIRKTSVDELPQLINVLKGEMSIVGPRPPLPSEVARYSLDDRRRLLVRPGITCLWQIGEREGRVWEIGDRNAIEFPEQVSLDVKYIESVSLTRDAWILLKTVPAVLLGRGGV